MADGTCNKQFESQMQQVNVTILDLQSRMDSLEAGSNRNHEAILTMDWKFDQKFETLDQKFETFEASMDGKNIRKEL